MQAFGFRNIQNVVRRVKTGKCPYDFVELMACPGGCANGGGQPRPPPLEASERVGRVEALFSNAEETTSRWPIDNPAVQAMYAAGGLLEGGPMGESAARYLHTGYHAREQTPPTAQSALTIKW